MADLGGGEGEGAEGPIEVGEGSEGVREMDRNEKQGNTSQVICIFHGKSNWKG